MKALARLRLASVRAAVVFGAGLAGSLASWTAGAPFVQASWLKALAQARARTVLTSGGVRPVMDGDGSKHSLFAKAFLEVLYEYDGVLEAQRLYRRVAARRVLHLAARYHFEQKPENAPLEFAGHEAGDLIFVPAGSWRIFSNRSCELRDSGTTKRTWN